MEQVIYIIGQILGIAAIVLGFLSFQTRTQKQLILLQTATSIVFCLHYLLIGAVTAAALNIVNIVRNIVYYFRDKKGDSSKLWPAIFAIASAITGILTWEAWYSVFIIAGLVINNIGMSFKEPQSVRKSILVSSPIVLIYDGFVLSLGGAIYETVVIISSVIGIIRYRETKKILS